MITFLLWISIHHDKREMVIWVPRISFFDWRPDIFEYIVSNIRGFWFFGNFIIPLREQGEALNNSHKGLISHKTHVCRSY